jgi:hypothetical protein
VLEIDHVIRFVPGRDAVDLDGFTVEPGRAHTGQGTRNVRVMFDRNYLEILWVEYPGEVVARGLDFLGRCTRPYTAQPFGCVLRGTMPAALRARFVPYELPDSPGTVLQLLAEQPAAAPFLAVFETDDREAMWASRRAAAPYLIHPNGARRIVHATFTCPAPPPIDELPDLRFASGAPRLDLDLDGLRRSYTP